MARLIGATSEGLHGMADLVVRHVGVASSAAMLQSGALAAGRTVADPALDAALSHFFTDGRTGPKGKTVRVRSVHVSASRRSQPR